MNEENVKVTIVETDNEIETYEPRITRKQLSVYEYCRVITDLANYLYNTDNIDKYIDTIEIHNIVDPCSLAFKLLESGKFDAIIDRGYERVTYSKCTFNNIYLDLVRSYIEQQENNILNEIFKKLKLI